MAKPVAVAVSGPKKKKLKPRRFQPV